LVWRAALAKCTSKLKVEPSKQIFACSILENVNKPSSSVGLDIVPISGFSIKSNQFIAESAQPKGFLLPLLSEQLRTVNWMIIQEKSNIILLGEESHLARIDVPPFQNLGVNWKLSIECDLRGGVLCDG
jgi:hypothetical protein